MDTPKQPQSAIEINREAIEWLDSVTKKDVLKTLVKEAGSTTLGAEHSEIDQFCFDIEEFLRLIRCCLNVRRTNVLKRVIDQKELPSTNIKNSVYQEAFWFVANRIPQTMNFQAKRELLACFTYLNEVLSQSN